MSTEEPRKLSLAEYQEEAAWEAYYTARDELKAAEIKATEALETAFSATKARQLHFATEARNQ
jgi:hypothetical protein